MSKTHTEIKSQYEAMKQSMAYLEKKISEIKKLFNQRSYSKIIFLGCGSSYHVAQSLRQVTKTQLNTEAEAYAAGDLLLHFERYLPALKGAFIVAVSRSGSTSELNMVVDRIKCLEVNTILSVTCIEGSKLSNLSHYSLEMPWAFDESICQTRTVSCLYTTGLALLAYLGQKEDLLTEINETILKGPVYFERYENVLKEIAEMDWEDVIVLADAELEGIAGEGALAFKEICRYPSNYYHILDCRHGPMIMIHSQTLVVIALSEVDIYERGLIDDLVNKGCIIIAYSDLYEPKLPSAVHQINFGKKLAHAVRGIPFILICQLISYYRALKNGENPDKPEGLEAWIKLEGVV